jgi:hypothetical protein
MIFRFILWWLSRPRSLWHLEIIYWKCRHRILDKLPYMALELNATSPPDWIPKAPRLVDDIDAWTRK